MKILICGYGNIGQHIFNEFESKNEISIYDKYKTTDEPLNDYYDAAFVCVPTEMAEDGSADLTEINDIIKKIHGIAKVIIIKSAIPVGTCRHIGLDNVVISPEYYGTTQHSLESPNFAILGGKQNAVDMASTVFQTVKDGSFRFIFTSWETAELAKYMENCWIATKVTFCNEFASIAERCGVSYNQLRECFIADERVSPSHTFVYPDQPFFNSHCLNKDVPALIKMCDNNSIDTPLMDSILKIKQDRQG